MILFIAFSISASLSFLRPDSLERDELELRADSIGDNAWVFYFDFDVVLDSSLSMFEVEGVIEIVESLWV